MNRTIFLITLVAISAIGFTQESTMNPKEMEAYMKKAALRTNPDYVCFVPGSFNGSTGDSQNEHFLVFDGPDGSLMSIWTQHITMNPEAKSHILFSKSIDKGVTWSKPKHLVGPKNKGDSTHITVWAFPMVSKSGRIYVLWNQNQGFAGWIFFHTGRMSGMYSDDMGKTWSEPQEIKMPLSPYDDPTGIVPSEWIVWQKPERIGDGKYFVGYSRWPNESKAYYNKKTAPSGWTWLESVVEFMKFENIDENPEPRDIKITYSAWGEQALRVPHYIEPGLSIAQEPSIVTLPDGRLFCVMRTGSGFIWYSVSADFGATWSNPRPLLRKDHGSPILQPVSCSPIYKLADGRYVLLHHNNRGDISDPSKIFGPRTPAYLALGEFRPGADQPIWFSESKIFVDNKGLNSAGELVTRGNDAATYTSFSTSTGKDILWYPDAKCWLLGKEVSEEFLKELKLPF